jgi:hypothetical protein
MEQRVVPEQLRVPLKLNRIRTTIGAKRNA